MSNDALTQLQQQMIEVIAAHAVLARDQIGKDTLDVRVLRAMARVPRHQFVPVEFTPYAYADHPLPIGFDKTMSQPFIIALMTDLLEVRPSNSVLEIGTGLGYHAAILAELASEVYTVEIVEELARQAERRLEFPGIRQYSGARRQW